MMVRKDKPVIHEINPQLPKFLPGEPQSQYEYSEEEKAEYLAEERKKQHKVQPLIAEGAHFHREFSQRLSLP